MNYNEFFGILYTVNVMDNKILEEQKRAREEFINLKKMQSGEVQPPEPTPATELSGVQKAKNNWHYDKWFIIIGIVLAVFIVLTVSQCFSKPKYDLEIVIYSSSPIYTDSAEQIGKYFEQFCEDTDNNGKINVLVTNCSYNKEGNNMDYERNNTIKLQSVLAANANALLYITDDTGYDYLNSIADELFEGEPVKLNSEFYDFCNNEQYFPLPENLQISCRTLKDSLIAKNKNIDKYYDASQKILDELTK